MPPSAMMVTPEAPENEVKNAQASTVTIAAPPRKPPNSALNTRIRRRGAPPSARKYPARVNSGIIGSDGFTTMR